MSTTHQPLETIATLPELRQYLDKMGSDIEALDLGEVLLQRATAMIESYLGFRYDGYTQGTKTVASYGSQYLIIPPHKAGSITQVATELGSIINASLYTIEAGEGIYLKSWGGGAPLTQGLTTWLPGRYTITGEWGMGWPPPDVVEVCLELAVNLWRERPKGAYSDAIGVEGSGGEMRVGYVKGLTNRQEMILKLRKQEYEDQLPVVVG